MKPAMVEIGSISTYEHGEYHVFEWRIPHFSTLDLRGVMNRTQISRFYHSPRFSFAGERWFWRLLANGVICEGTSGLCELSLRKCRSGRSIKATFSISLKTANGGKYKEEHCTRDFRDSISEDTHYLPGFISTTELNSLSSELLPDDVLTVVCAMKGETSAGRDSDPASAEICTPASGECRHSGGNFATASLSSHQRQCEQRPVKCPDCSEVVMLQKFLNEHDCLQERPEAPVEACTQTENNALRQVFTQTEKQEFREASTQIMGKRYYNCRGIILVALCIASIIIAVVTGCVLTHSETPLSPLHPNREAVTKIETSELNNTINGSELDGSGSNKIGDADIMQSEKVNKAAELTLTVELDAELNRADQSEILGSDNSVASGANQADTDETDESTAAKTQIYVSNRTDVVESDEFEASGSDETSPTDIEEYEGIDKTLTVETKRIKLMSQKSLHPIFLKHLQQNRL